MRLRVGDIFRVLSSINRNKISKIIPEAKMRNVANIIRILIWIVRINLTADVLTVQGFLPATLTLLIKVGLYFYFNLYFL